MTAGDAAARSAVFEWQDGARRLAAVRGPARAACFAVVEAVHMELKRRLGRTFTVADLAGAHRDAVDWFLPLAMEVAPRHGEAHDSSVALDGAFALYMRRAIDAGLLPLAVAACVALKDLGVDAATSYDAIADACLHALRQRIVEKLRERYVERYPDTGNPTVG